MKVKCIKCQIVEELKEEDIKLLAYIVHKYNNKPNPVDYISILSIIKGFCSDSDKHAFIFDEAFDKEVADTIKEYNDAMTINVERKAALEKIEKQIIETAKVIEELEKKKEYAIAEMNAGGMLVDNIKLKFLKLTGSEDMKMWS